MTTLKILILLISISTISAAFTQAVDPADSSEYKKAFALDHLWPSHVTPRATITDPSGAPSLGAGIPLVLVRAYEDGKLAVIDRGGSRLIAHSKTDFIERVKEAGAKDEDINARILLNQLGRRTYDRSHDTTKAVSEIELARYSKFLIIRDPGDEESLLDLKELLNERRDHFDRGGIRPVLLLDAQLSNQAFYELIKTVEIPFPVVVPVFQQGVSEAIFSAREEEDRVLLLAASGKLIGKYERLSEYLDETGETSDRSPILEK